jgi:hypothetical protein
VEARDDCLGPGDELLEDVMEVVVVAVMEDLGE